MILVSGEYRYETRGIPLLASNRPVAINAALRLSNCFQSERAKPKSKSRVNRPGGLPNMFSRIRSRAVAPVRKNGKRNAFAVCQVLAWLAKERRDVEEQLEWSGQIGTLVRRLLRTVSPALGAHEERS